MLEEKISAERAAPLHLLEKERELISQIKLGADKELREQFAEILEYIYTLESGNLKFIKARVMELMLVFSRAVVDNGADFEEVTKVNTKFIFGIVKCITVHEITFAVQEALEIYMQAVAKVKNENRQLNKVSEAVKEFILANYHRSLGLEDIAQVVGLSSYRVCHLFKEVEGLTVIEYLNQVRIEKAKQLLTNPKYNIHEVSRRLGYKDPSYFARVFRRTEGTSPSEFRKQA